MTSISDSASSSEGAGSARRPWRTARLWPAAVAAAVLAVLVAAGPTAADAKVLYAKDEALALAFPADARVSPRTVFLTDADVAAVKARAGVAPDSKLFTYYIAARDDAVVGYGVIETHTVRTLPETFLAVLTPQGTIERVLLLAFYEPPEYQPSERWLRQFERRGLGSSGWRLGHDLHGISGATLTAHAITDALRRILVLYERVMRPAAPGS
jgi:hypothetical protein